MKKKLTVAVGMVAIIWVVFGLHLLASTNEKIRLFRIPEEKKTSISNISFTSGVLSFCAISNDDGTPAWSIGNIGSNWAFAVYMDPAKCSAQPTYPFKITDVHFFLTPGDTTAYSWPVDIQVNIRGVTQGNRCNGPDTLTSLHSESFAFPIDSSLDSLNRMINYSLSVPFCVNQPFFLEIKYISTPSPGKNFPSLTMDSEVPSPDTCNNWGRTGDKYWEWYDFWEGPPPVGDLMIRATGYTGITECDSFWYWKPDTNDLRSGMPDFDQYQFASDSLGMCGPTAVANCLRWFGAVPEGMSPPDLIRLLSNFFHTDPNSGTYVDSMQAGLGQYFRDYGFKLYEHTFFQPKFKDMEDSLKKCQDVILLLGFYQFFEGKWTRFGGHYVTMAGVCSESLKIAISDPFRDAAEGGWPGIVEPPHPPHPQDNFLHNNPDFVSHDVYQSDTLSETPGNPHWWIPGYETLDTLYLFEGKNVQPGQSQLQGPYMPELPVYTEVEYAVMICPGAPDTCWYWKPDTTNAPSGMPDFDQYQFGPPDSDAFCGPAAVANCLWWFNAVPSDYQNDPAGFIRYLAKDYFDTDPDSGTFVDSIQSGLDQYFADHGFSLRETTYVKPNFQEMEDSLKKCQDIILLLGFWQENDGVWSRVGGHFVTMSGVCSSSGWVAFSDPARDAAEAGRPGRVRPQVHPPHITGDTLHNDPQYVSHDMYQALLGSPSPGGLWGLPAYDSVYQFEGDNFQPGQPPPSPYDPTKPTFTEVEYAIMICPKPSAVGDREEDLIPKKLELYQNHPNPFNTETQIKYQLKKASFVTLSIYNILGEKVRTLVKEKQAGGLKTITWDGRDEKGNEVSSGIYFYELKAGEVTQTKRMVLLK
jgi:hypothetical protein